MESSIVDFPRVPGRGHHGEFCVEQLQLFSEEAPSKMAGIRHTGLRCIVIEWVTDTVSDLVRDHWQVDFDILN